MFDEKKWTTIEPEILALPGGEKLCEFIRKGHKPWGEIGEAMYCHKGFPKEEFYVLAVIGHLDIRWPLTFAAWYCLSSGESIDEECADFYTNTAAWDHVLAVLPQYSCIDGLSDWVERFIQYRKPFQSLHPLKDKSKTPSLEEMDHKLNCLRALDKRFLVFGAGTHQYKNHTLSNEEIESTEVKIGIRLPEEYRQFLLQIGYGAGPYYGVFSPAESVSVLLEDQGKQETWPPKPAQPFPVTPEQANECWRVMSEGHYAAVKVYWPANGCIPICNAGSIYSTFLITAGDLVGSLWSRSSPEWDPSKPYDENWNLAPQPYGISNLHKFFDEPLWHQALSPLPTFLEWYNAWLDQCLSDFEELNKKEEPEFGKANKSKSLADMIFSRLRKKK